MVSPQVDPGFVPIPLADIADGVPLDLEVSSDGMPHRPFVVVDLSSAGALTPAEVNRAVTRIGRALPIAIGLEADTAGVPDALLRALSLTVTSPGPHVPVWAVPVDRPASVVAELAVRICSSPRAAVTLGRLLRQTAVLPVVDGLAAESAAYSTLLGGPEFSRWLGVRGRPRSEVPGTLDVTRTENLVRIVLARPERRNAINAPTRDALVDALGLLGDPDVTVEISGLGPSFSAGGDLDEFGSAPDVATAHVVRLDRSVGMLIDADRDRVTALVHGACFGAGCELPAFAGRVVAAPDTRLALPELALGLVPGAGGTVSVTRRVGRWRSAWLALSGQPIDASTALRWGLVDELAG